MSYQFEDESALEELLNQQLDLRRQQTIRTNPIPQTSISRPSTARPTFNNGRLGSAEAGLGSKIPRREESPKSDGISMQSTVPIASSQREDPLNRQSKFSSWFDQPKSSQNPSTPEITPKDTSLTRSSNGTSGIKFQPTKSETNKQDDEDDQFVESNLQAMSKQRLIKLITDEIVPNMNRLKSFGNESLNAKLKNLQTKLELEQSRVESMAKTHDEQCKMIESKWQQLYKQLELQLDLSNRELAETLDRQREFLTQVNDEHQRQLTKMAEGYQAKLAQERQAKEEALRRRDELHELEMSSKVNVDRSLSHLETTFSEWQSMIKSTIRSLEVQFKSVDGLLEIQATKVNATNEDLASKSADIKLSQMQITRQTSRLEILAGELGEVLPKLTKLSESSETSLGRLGDLLKTLAGQTEEMGLRSGELGTKLDEERSRLADLKLQLGIESSRLACKEETLLQQSKNNEVAETRLVELRSELTTREARLEAALARSEVKTNELREMNQELHLARRKLVAREEQLSKRRAELSKDKKSLRQDEVKLAELRFRLERELDQLRRLEKSLVCTMCLERLFKLEDRNKATCESDNKWPLWSGQLGALGPDGQLDLVELSRHAELDLRRLKTESKYVDLISPS